MTMTEAPVAFTSSSYIVMGKNRWTEIMMTIPGAVTMVGILGVMLLRVEIKESGGDRKTKVVCVVIRNSQASSGGDGPFAATGGEEFQCSGELCDDRGSLRLECDDRGSRRSAVGDEEAAAGDEEVVGEIGGSFCR
ncbi:hypothetical protein E3N88_42685 [Mikania micrantha]|uniref:Uncharacterized protein n=1 Tax=Mikania micrantha TaxID=192012 RepID=A0A5N6LH67_9ASTR|nr:hypothetical protein E3N88_42685 [Mikania micrantha]